jgi:hypothetical protein
MNRDSCLSGISPLVLDVIALFKPLHPAGGIQHSPLTGEKGVALAAYLYLEVFLGGAGGKSVAAGAYHLGVVIVSGMYLFLHGLC